MYEIFISVYRHFMHEIEMTDLQSVTIASLYTGLYFVGKWQ